MIDKDLAFLERCNNEDLKILVDYITTDSDGETRYTESLTESYAYQENYPDNIVAFVDEIVDELLKFGGNSIANFFRGGGVPYKELLCDVCDKMDVRYNKNASVEMIENNFLQTMLIKSLDEMSPQEKEELFAALDLKTTNFTKQGLTAALQLGINLSGFTAYKIAVIVANAIAKAILGHGLSLATNAAITRTIGIFAGPIGWAFTAAWTTYDIAGPAYRVTIPAVAQICYMRRSLEFKQLADMRR